MKILIATDIHGITAELRSMIEPVISGAVFLSPWDTETSPFSDEQEAVSSFISRNGIETYAEKIASAANQEAAFIIGFSVGASAAWLHSASQRCHLNSVATLFYGSRIRDYSLLVPRINITAIFAATESSFSPDQIAAIIARDNVQTLIEPGTFHGFMNPLSANFAATQCTAHLHKLALDLTTRRANIQSASTG
jgi:dienelactone hydrolase